MYNERRENFSIRDIVLQLLFVLLFIFILMWLFPLKKDLSNEILPLYETRFNENVNYMKDAAQSYFTTPRLPEKIGDTVKLTLAEMLEKKIILPFLDSNNSQCDLVNSYVEITKMDDEYILKVNLECTDKSDYVLVYMGCYDYCKTDICEKEEEPVKQVDNDKSNPVKPSPTPNKPNPNPNPTPIVNKKYIYEYKKVTDSYYSNWSNWSGWSTTQATKTNLREVESKNETTYKEEIKVVATKRTTETVKTPETKTVKHLVDNKVTKVCEKYDTVYVKTGEYKYGADWVAGGLVTLTSKPTSTTTKIYVPISTVDSDCGDCSSATSTTYRIYTKSSYELRDGVYQCVKYGVKEDPIYINRTVPTGKYITETKVVDTPVYGKVKTPITTTYYRVRTRSVIEGKSDIKWSSYNDQSLLNNGYKYTGKRNEVK